MVSGKRLVEIGLVVLVLTGLAVVFAVTGFYYVRDRIEERITAELDIALAAVAPVIELLYPTPISGEFDPQSPPVPDIDAARARFVEGGELLPGGGKLCLNPDGSGLIVMPNATSFEFTITEQALQFGSKNEGPLREGLNEHCPAELR